MKCLKSLGARAVLLKFLLSAAVAWSQEATIYHGFTLVDPEKAALIDDAYVVIDGQRIVEVGSGEPPNVIDGKFVDMSGTYAMPGLFDGHAHITGGPIRVEMQDGHPKIRNQSIEKVTRYHALMALASGVTTLRNPAGNTEANAQYNDMIAQGNWIGPEALHAGRPFDPVVGIYPSSADEWERKIRYQRSLGMQFVKLYAGLTEDELAIGIAAAHANGMKTIGHLDQVSWTRAAELGIDALSHALPTSADLLTEPARTAYIASREGIDSKYMYHWFELADFDSEPIQRMIQSLVERNIVVDLTMVVNEIIYFYDEVDKVFPEADREYIHPLIMETWFQNMSASHIGWDDEDYQRAHAVMPKVLELARRLHDAGVQLLVGTDGYGGGPDYVRELELHVKAGIPAWDVLDIATNLSASRLEISNRTGAIRPGLEADMVFLKGDPVQDISNVGDIQLVLSNGEAFTPEALMRMATTFVK